MMTRDFSHQVLVTIMAGVGAQSAYATDIVAVQRVLYHQTSSFTCRASIASILDTPELNFDLEDKWLLVMSTQLIGFSIGGIARRFLVTPPSMSMAFPLALYEVSHTAFQSGQTPSYHVLCSIPSTPRAMLALVYTKVSAEKDFSCTPSVPLFYGVSLR